ncbi:hypothetical protein BKD26_26120 [Streptomyces sp. CB03238]|nr:hypothetical protein BKD26_26120 [Streptomyces sp. CB03238]
MEAAGGDQRSAGAASAEISLTLPDGQTVRVRLHERREVPGLYRWRYLVRVPAGTARREGVEAAEYAVRVADPQLTPIEGWTSPPCRLAVCPRRHRPLVGSSGRHRNVAGGRSCTMPRAATSPAKEERS